MAYVHQLCECCTRTATQRSQCKGAMAAKRGAFAIHAPKPVQQRRWLVGYGITYFKQPYERGAQEQPQEGNPAHLRAQMPHRVAPLQACAAAAM
jgi:hypothetical protein